MMRARVGFVALGPRNPDAVGALLDIIGSGDYDKRLFAAYTLFAMGPESVLVLTNVLVQETHATRRASAAFALGRFGTEAHSALPALLRGLHDIEPEVRIESGLALGEIRQEVEKVVPALRSSFRRSRQARSAECFGSSR